MFAYASLAAGLVGFIAWLQQEQEREYRSPSKVIGPAVFRILERAHRRLFRDSPDIRFTIFAPEPTEPDVLKPVARLGWGRPSKASELRFKKGEGLAGMAWEQSKGMLLVEFDGLERSDLERARGARQTLLGLRPGTAALLSEEHLLHSRVLLAINLVDGGGGFKGVLSIDFRDPVSRSSRWMRIPFFSRPSPVWTADRIANNARMLSELSSIASELALALPPENPHLSKSVEDVFGAKLTRIVPLDAA
jgi:hypothetical protein